MKIAKKLPIVRIENVLINLERLAMARLSEDASYSGHWVIQYVFDYNETVFEVTFPRKKEALAALDTLAAAVDIPVIEESDSD